MKSLNNLMRSVAINLILIAGLTSTPGHAANESARPLAVANGDTVTTDMMLEELAHMHSGQAAPVNRGDFKIEALLQKLINNRLIVQDARALEMDQDPDVVRQMTALHEGNAMRYFLSTQLGDTLPRPESDLQQIYAEYYRSFRLRLVCVSDENLATDLLDSLQGGASMDRLAATYSVDRFKEQGGDGGYYALARVPRDLQEWLKTAKIGDIFGPANLWRVWAIVRVEELRPADPALYDSTRQEVVMLARELKRLQRQLEISDSLARIYPVQIDSNLVDSVIVLMRAGLPADDRPVITVAKNRKLTASELRNKYIHRISGISNRQARNVLLEVVRDQRDLLLMKEAVSQPAYLQSIPLTIPEQAFEDSLLINAYLADVLATQAVVTDADIEKYYQENPQLFRQHGRLRIATIMRATLEKAQESYQSLLAGSDFTWLAKRESEDELRELGGLRDWMSWGEFPASWQQQLDTLAVGGCLPPLEVDQGYWIIKLVEREPEGRLALDAVRARVRKVLEEQAQIEAVDSAIRALRQSAQITIFDEALERIRLVGSTK